MIQISYDPKGDPLCRGEFGDVWKGKHDGREVAAKVLRVYQTCDFKKVKKVGSRLVMCFNN